MFKTTRRAVFAWLVAGFAEIRSATAAGNSDFKEGRESGAKPATEPNIKHSAVSAESRSISAQSDALGVESFQVRRPEPPAVFRLLTSRNDETVYARDYCGDAGSAGQYVYEFTQNFKDMVKYAPAGAVLEFSHGIDGSSFADFRIADPVTITKHLSLHGRNSRIVGDMSDHTKDLIRYVPASEIRNVSIKGLRLAFNTGGRHALWIGNGSVGILSSHVHGCNIAGGPGGDAIHLEGLGAQYNQVMGSTLYCNNAAGAGVHLAGADGSIIQGNLIQGIGTGVRCALIRGAYKSRILSNGVTTRDTGVYVTAGQQIDIEGNQFEQPASSNTAIYRGHIVLLGSGSAYLPTPSGEEVRDIRIIGNNFGGGSNLDSAIYFVANTLDCILDENVFANIGKSGADITIVQPTARYTRIGNRNRVYGNRVAGGRGGANTQDSKTLLIVADAGIGTYGYAARKGFAGLTARGAGWSGASLEFWKEENDALRFSGTLTVDTTVGAATPGFAIGTLPVGMRPSETLKFSVANNLTSTLSYLTIDTAGVIKVDAGVASSSTLYINGVSGLPIKGHADYLSGSF